MRRHVSLGLILGLCLVFALCANTSFGQAVYGSIIGTVTDPQGNAVAGAKVTVTSITKNTSEETTTNESGNFSVIHLIPDTYRVKIEGPGFKAYDVASVLVQVDTTARVDAQLQVGAVTQTVEVTGEVPQLKTDRADVSLDFNSDYVEKLPLVNRNFQSLLLSAPGTQQIGWSHAATENPQGSQQTFVQGQHFSGTGYELDGTDNQDPILGIIIINPNLDSVEEAKITLMNYDAEFGKAIAGLVVASTKSGTNDIHGSAFWFRNSDATLARDPFGPTKLPSSKWNQFGGSVGGAIIKNKLFYFGDYQGTRQANGFSQKITIPTAKVLSTCTATTAGSMCDLSEYLGAVAGGNGQVYDPSTGNPNTGAGRTAFNGNLIPVTKLDPVAVALLKRFPQPLPGTGVTNNFIVSGSGPFHANTFDGRGDYQAPGNLHIFGRYTRAFYSLNGQPGLGIGLGGLGGGIGGLSGSSNIHNHSLAAGFDKAISSTLLTDFRFGWFQYNPHSIKPDSSVAAAQAVGLQGLNIPSDPNTGGLPTFRFDNGNNNNTGLTDFGDGLDPSRCNCPLIEKEHQYQFVNNWTKIKGNHSMKVGVDLRFAYNLRIPSDNNRTGQLSFNHLETSSGGSTGQIGGLDLASFLLGDVSFFDRFVGASQNASESQKRLFLYAQDGYRMTNKLTLTYGLRWEDYTPESVNAKGNGGFANLKQGEIRVAGFGPYGLNGGIDSSLLGFAPRIGIAYQLRPKTVVRLGYGRSYDLGVFGSNFGHAVTQNLPVLVHQTVNATDSSALNVNGVVPVYSMSGLNGLPNQPPSSASAFPVVPSSGLLPLKGPTNTVDPRIRPTKQRVASVDMWNATVQHQLTSTMTLEVAYLGNKGSHGFAGNGPTYNVNQKSMVGYGTVAPDQRRPFFNKFTYPGYIDPATGTTMMCCVTDLGNYFGMDASSNYNALQLKAEKRISQGLQFVSHYTFSRARYYDGNYFAIDPKIAYGPMNVNRNHVWVTNILYELPFGKGKKYMSDANTLMDTVIGGWRLTSTTNWSGGLPWTPQFSDCGLDQDVGVCRPNKGSGSLKTGVHRDPATGVVTWFTPVFTPATSATGCNIPGLSIFLPGTCTPDPNQCAQARPTIAGFARTACGTLGNIGMDSFRGPHLFTSNLSLAKNFRITERYKAEFRMDANNIFNHPVMGFNYTQGNTCIDCAGPLAPFNPGSAGQITSIDGNTSMRLLTFGLRFSF